MYITRKCYTDGSRTIKFHWSDIRIFIVFLVKDTACRDLRDPGGNGLLLSALCIEDGQLRKSCLEG